VNQGFKRSARFGLIGVVIVAIACAAIGLTLGDGASPTAALIPILVIVFGFVAALLTLQRRDLERAAAADERAAFGPADAEVTDPTTVDADALMASLATGPIDRDAAAAARGRAWGMARGSLDAGARMIVLIFCAVVPWIVFQFVWSLVVFVPIIVAYAGWLSARAIGPGGQLDQGFDDSAATIGPLGLRLIERPRVAVNERLAGPGAQAELEGAVAYAGRRHGRAVSVRLEGLGATTTVAAPTERFEVAAKGERLRVSAGAPPGVAAALEPLRASSYWRGVEASGDGERVVVARRRGGGEHWLRDLWLAERLAAAAPPL
jgi:hypothetical protein